MNSAPSGLQLLPGFLTEQQQQALKDALDGLAYSTFEMHGKVARREVAHYGWVYGYESWKLTPGPPVPSALFELQQRAAQLADLESGALEEVLVSRYPPGAGIGWHRDAPMFGPTVIGVSVTGPGRMRFRRKVGEGWETWATPLEPGSAYVLSGDARRVWQHSLTPVKELRYSVTFRTLRARAARDNELPPVTG